MKKILALLFSFSFLTSFSQKIPANYFYVKTNDSLPFLKYSLGEDRLGSAKMTLLDSGVILKVVDSIKTDYKVQLSQLHSAWIDKKNVIRMPKEKHQENLTDSWKVYGDSLFDYVTIQLSEKLPYKSDMEIHPAEIVIDIFGAYSNTNWIRQLSTAKEIKNAWYVQPEDDVLRVFIELKHGQHWGYKISYDSLNRLTIRVKRQPPVLNIKNLTIAIDAGHGGDNMGATGILSNSFEKEYTLSIAKEVQKILLAKKAKVIMTRTKDTSISMYSRINFLAQQNPDILVSIHLNSADEDSVNGVSTYYRYVGFRSLSQSILKSMLLTGLHEYGNIGSFNFALNGPTDYPNCLVEVAFLSNKNDERKILNRKFRQLVARRIVAGIEDFLKNL